MRPFRKTVQSVLYVLGFEDLLSGGADSLKLFRAAKHRADTFAGALCTDCDVAAYFSDPIGGGGAPIKMWDIRYRAHPTLLGSTLGTPVYFSLLSVESPPFPLLPPNSLSSSTYPECSLEAPYYGRPPNACERPQSIPGAWRLSPV